MYANRVFLNHRVNYQRRVGNPRQLGHARAMEVILNVVRDSLADTRLDPRSYPDLSLSPFRATAAAALAEPTAKPSMLCHSISSSNTGH